MITLFDLSAEFWRNYFVRKSALEAYERTMDSILFYRGRSERLAILCDGPRLLRCVWSPEYKGNRPPKPQDAVDALQSVKEQCQLLGLPVVECEGYEADDLMATLVRQAWPEDVQLIVEDKDLYALVCETVWLTNRRGLVNEAKCVEKFGVQPNQIRDYLALCGDNADNIEGCPLIGPAKAGALLRKFGTIDGIRAAADEEILSIRGISHKILDSIRAWDPTMAVKLATLLDDAPVNLEELWPIAAE